MTRPGTLKETDITVYGATSFVAKHVIQYLLQACALDTPDAKTRRIIKVTLGGRNLSKLQALQEKFSTEDIFGVIEGVAVASGSDLPALIALASRSRVILNCAGPYSLYSSLVVEACATVGTDYVDITGEVAWVAEMRQTYGHKAQASGARIISLCGYDSIPSDIALFAAVTALKGKVGQCNVQEGKVWHQMFGLANGGTVQTAVDLPIDIANDFTHKEDQQRKLRYPPFFLGDPLQLSHPTNVRHNPDYHSLKNHFAKGEWINQLPMVDINFHFGVSIPMPMAAINQKVMQASSVACGYGTSMVIRERFVPLGFFWTRIVGIFSLVPALILQGCILVMVAIAKTPWLGKTLANLIAPAGSGAPDYLCSMGGNSVYAVATSAPDPSTRLVHRGYAYIAFQGDAGNYVTAQCVSEAALALIVDRDRLPPRSDDGFGTPAELLGSTLLERFRGTQVRSVVVQMSARTQVPKNELKVVIQP